MSNCQQVQFLLINIAFQAFITATVMIVSFTVLFADSRYILLLDLNFCYKFLMHEINQCN